MIFKYYVTPSRFSGSLVHLVYNHVTPLGFSGSLVHLVYNHVTPSGFEICFQ